MNVGVVGCGAISETYLRNLASLDGLDVVAVADRDQSRAENAAARHGLDAEPDVASLLRRDDVDTVLNLTVPAAHAAVSLAAIEAGKHVYSEKPFATTVADGQTVLDAARRRGVTVGCAPDTFLGSAMTLARGLVHGGAIGAPVAAFAEWTSPGHESWHPDPGFLYRRGGGPMLDMGPYYVTGLVTLLGPVAEVAATTSAAYDERVTPRGERLPVEVPTHVAGLLRFASGVTATIVTSFDLHGGRGPRLDVHGTDGTVRCADPNGFDGPVALYRDGAWETHQPEQTGDRRGLGLADLAEAVRERREPRASGAQALHVLHVMESLVEAGESHSWVRL